MELIILLSIVIGVFVLMLMFFYFKRQSFSDWVYKKRYIEKHDYSDVTDIID